MNNEIYTCNSMARFCKVIFTCTSLLSCIYMFSVRKAYRDDCGNYGRNFILPSVTYDFDDNIESSSSGSSSGSFKKGKSRQSGNVLYHNYWITRVIGCIECNATWLLTISNLTSTDRSSDLKNVQHTYIIMHRVWQSCECINRDYPCTNK